MFPQPAGPELAKVLFQIIYGREPDPAVADDMVVRDEYLRWLIEIRPLR